MVIYPRPVTVAYIGFHFGGGGGVFKIFWKSGGICMGQSVMQRVAIEATRLLGGLGSCSLDNLFLNYAIWRVLENILLKFCKNKIGKIFNFYIKIIDNVLLRTLYLGVLEHTPHISCQLCNLVYFGAHFRELSLKIIYINI